MKLTLFHDGQFWVGVVERITDEGLFATRHVFGSEPQGEEVFEFVKRQLNQLVSNQTVAVDVKPLAPPKLNPKRLARQVMREATAAPVSTKAQEAMQMQLEANKKEKQTQTKQQRLAEQEQKWLLSREKAKKRHRGK